MLKRYCVTYVGDDSYNHHEIVWASDHNEAIKKMKAKDVDMVVGVRKTKNPLIIVGIVVLVVVAIIVELAH